MWNAMILIVISYDSKNFILMQNVNWRSNHEKVISVFGYLNQNLQCENT